MSIDKLKSIAERSERECAGFMGIDGLFVQHYLELRAALNAAIKAIEVLSAANEFYLQIPVDNDEDYFHYHIPRGVTYLTAPSGKRARRAKLEADEILKGVAE